MGKDDRKTHGRPCESVNAQRALGRIMPMLKRMASHPERFSERERALIVDLVQLASLGDSTTLLRDAAEVLLAMEE